MTYKEFIDNILQTRGRFGCGDEYHERHHIVPKCMGGGNEEDNLIDLYAREHFKAHRLLALENYENDGLTYAWWMMAHMSNTNQRDYEITAEEYEEAKKSISISISGENNPNYGKRLSQEEREAQSKRMSGQNNPMYGKHHSEETKDKLRKSRLGKKMPYEVKDKIREANHKRIITQKTREKLKNINLGRKISDITRKKISESKKGLYVGENNPNYGNHKMAGKNNPTAKIICQFYLNMKIVNVWNFIKEASKKLNIHPNSISICCHHETRTAGGYIWHYLYDFIKKDGTIIPGAITLGLITEEEALRMLKKQKETEGESYGN